MRVVHAIGSFNIGGAEKQFMRTVINLRKSGVEVCIIVLKGVGPLQSLAQDNSILYFSFLPKSFSHKTKIRKILVFLFIWPFLLFRLFRIIKSFNPDIVHAWLIHSAVFILPLAFFARVPIRIFARRGLLSGYKFKRVGRLFTHWANLFTTHFTSNSQMTINEMVRIERIQTHKITYIPNGIDKQIAQANALTQPPQVIMVANFIFYKNHKIFLHALSNLACDFRIVLVGSGILEEEIKELAKKFGLADKMSFLGTVEDVIPLYLKSQLCVLTSDTEGMPNVILEAMSCGLPIISTDVGAVSSLLHDGLNGLLIPNGNLGALTSGLEKLISSPELREKFALSHSQILANFSWEKVTFEYLSLYVDLENRLLSK